MKEVLEHTKNRKLPLHASHEKLNAVKEDRDGFIVAASYGDAEQEYFSIRRTAGLIDLSFRGRIRVSGSEAVQFLNGLITNDMKTLAENHWMPAAFPNVQGRLIAAVRVFRIQDEQTNKGPSPVFILDTEAATHNSVFKTIQRFTMAGDFRVEDITDTTALISVQGPSAAKSLANIFAVGGSNENYVRALDWHENEILLIHGSHTGEDGFDLIVPNETAEALWDALLSEGITPVGVDALETLRIEAGIPKFGVDMDETMVVSEANLDDAVSFTKGCYVGQEIIARIKYRGHVAKKITGVMFDSDVTIERGAKLLSEDGKEAGHITSVTRSPQLKKTIALAVVKYQHLEPGTKLTMGSANIAATVVELPFVRNAQLS